MDCQWHEQQRGRGLDRASRSTGHWQRRNCPRDWTAGAGTIPTRDPLGSRATQPIQQRDRCGSPDRSELFFRMTEPDLYCSFCAASQYDVRALIAGPRVYVCDGCVMLMATILGRQDPRWLDPAVAEIRQFELLSNTQGVPDHIPSPVAAAT